MQADTSSSEEESSDEEDTPVKANGAATPNTAKVFCLLNLAAQSYSGNTRHRAHFAFETVDTFARSDLV